MDNEGELQRVFDSLVDQHGCVSPSDIAICRSMAILLTESGGDPNDDHARARTCNNLAALLPPRKPFEPVDRIEVVLVSPGGKEVPWPEERQDEIRGLRAEIEVLRQKLAGYEIVP